MKRILVDVQEANSGVSGSCQLYTIYFPEEIVTANGFTNKLSFMADCGSAQGNDEKNGYINPFYDHINLEDVSFILLTHAHLDHYGNIPRLIKNGFYNPIFTTKETATFLERVSLDDCYKIQKRVAKRTHTEPLYEEFHINLMKQMMIPCKFNQKIVYNDNICFYFFSNGHVPGAAVILIRISLLGYETVNLLLTGDYSSKNKFFKVTPIPEWVTNLPVTIVTESTYGATNSSDVNAPCLINNLAKLLSEQKRIIIPTFAFGRTQEVLADINQAILCGKLPKNTIVNLDGTTAQENTRLFLEGTFDMFPSMQNFIPKNTVWVSGKIHRRKIIDAHMPSITIASSGMLSYGASQVYVRHFISDPNSAIHLSGYCSPCSNAGKLKDADIGSKVNVGGFSTIKQAKMYETAEYSAHDKADDFIRFFNQFKIINSIYIRHGEPDTKNKFDKRIRQEVNVKGNIAVSSIDYIFRITSDGIVSSFPTKI